MPAHDDRSRRYLDGPAVDPATGLPPGEATALTDRDRQLSRLRRREQWVAAISVPPPTSRGETDTPDRP